MFTCFKFFFKQLLFGRYNEQKQKLKENLSILCFRDKLHYQRRPVLKAFLSKRECYNKNLTQKDCCSHQEFVVKSKASF
jgi:hypothetical protein